MVKKFNKQVNLFDLNIDIENIMIFLIKNTKLSKEEIIKRLAEVYTNFTIDYITNMYNLYEDEYILYKKVSKILVSFFIKNLELFFNHKITSIELKNKILNEPELVKYKDYYKLDELVNLYFNMLNSFKKLRAELQLIIGSPANSLAIEELSKKLKSKYPELTLEEIQNVIIQIEKNNN